MEAMFLVGMVSVIILSGFLGGALGLWLFQKFSRPLRIVVSICTACLPLITAYLWRKDSLRLADLSEIIFSRFTLMIALVWLPLAWCYTKPTAERNGR